MQLLRMSSTMSLMISMNNVLIMNPDASALQEEDAGKLIKDKLKHIYRSR